MTPDVEFVNTDQRVACVLTLDKSGSMAGAPIAALNDGLRVFQQELQNDPMAQSRVDLAILEFGDDKTIVTQDFISARDFRPPTLTANGNTPTGAAVITSLDLVTDRKRYYKEQGIDYYRPWILLVSDGKPTDDWHWAAERVHREEENKQVSFFAVGCGNDVDMNILTQIAAPHRPPRHLDGLKFRELFQWLSKSMHRVSTSRTGTQVTLPPVNGWTTA